MNKSHRIIYRTVTALYTLLIFSGAMMYLTQYDMVHASFTNLGFPTYIIYPLAIVKLAGLFVLWYKKFPTLTEWAYAGFIFNMILATTAHMNIGDGEFAPALGGLVLVAASYWFYRKEVDSSEAEDIAHASALRAAV